ncbi:MAG: hypothetical protein COA91_07185 [Robiginitomaculum sp.]|nr:MAG: hypothetical protein COA91_07185 [Robiginitomaculum sp.]
MYQINTSFLPPFLRGKWAPLAQEAFPRGRARWGANFNHMQDARLPPIPPSGYFPRIKRRKEKFKQKENTNEIY